MIKQFTYTLFALFLTSYLFAQKAPDEDTIEVTITAYKAEISTPATFQNISSAQFQAINTGQEPSFLLSQLSPSVTVYSDAGSGQGYSYFRLRGIDQTRVNMTLNGVPLNEPEDQGAYFSNYPDFFNSVSNLQIQRGVGISQNGTASYAGSMQFFSPNLTDSAQGSVGLGYGSFNTYRVFGEYQSGLRKNKAFYLRGTHLHSNGYKRNSGNSSQSLFYSGQWFANKHSLKLTGFAGHQQNEMAWLGVSDSIINTDRRFNANSTQEDDRFIQNLTMLQHEYYPSVNSKLSTSVYYNILDGNYDLDLNNLLGLPLTTELYNYAFRSHFVGLFSNFSTKIRDLNLTTGLHANWYTRRHRGSEASLGNLYTNRGYKKEASAFAKADYDLGQFNFFADLQLRFAQFDFRGDVIGMGILWGFFNPKAGICWQPNKLSALYYSIGRVGREPTRTDIFGGNDEPLRDSLGALITFITSPEYVIDQELGYRAKGKNWSWNANLFYMQFKNEIVLNGKFGPNGLALNAAFAKSFRSGVEIQGEWRPIAGLSISNASSFNYSRISEQGISFSPIYTPFLIVNQTVAYSLNGFRIGLDARYQSQSFIDFGNTIALDDYLLLNGQFSYSIQGWTFSFMVNNILNSKYFNQGYVDWDGTAKYFVQAPLNLYGMVVFRF